MSLYRHLSPHLQPSAHDWLEACWRTAAEKRWRALIAIGDPDRLLMSALSEQQHHHADAGAGDGPGQGWLAARWVLSDDGARALAGGRRVQQGVPWLLHPCATWG